MKPVRDDEAFAVVRSGYDRIAPRYLTDREKIDIDSELSEFSALLRPGAKVLDVGCGTGVPVARFLAKSGFAVTGIDLSEAMIAVARREVPAGRFLRMNMVELDFPAETFDGLVSCYAVFHVPRELHGKVFQSFHLILKPGAIMLVSLGGSGWEGTEPYFGVPMFWSHYDPATSEKLIDQAGFAIEFGRTIHRGGEVHHWVLARKRDSTPR